MSNSFEININADEWLDITSKEELLQTELSQCKNQLDTKSMELLESNVTIDLLKGHKTLLENERDSLQSELEQSKAAVERAHEEIHDLSNQNEVQKRLFEAEKTVKDDYSRQLEQSLNLREQELENTCDQVASLNRQIASIRKDQETEQKNASGQIDQLNRLVEKLKNNVTSLEGTSKKQQDAFRQAQNELKESRAREEALRKELARQKNTTEMRSKELKNVQGTVGTVSLLAEDLKYKKNELVRTLNQQEQELNSTKKELAESRNREATLKTRLATLASESGGKIEQLEQTVVKNLETLERAEDRMVGLESYVDDLKEQCVALSEERETVQANLSQKEEMCKDLEEQKAVLEEELKATEASTGAALERVKGFLEREEQLKEELVRQKAAFDTRLREIRSILGVSVVAELKSELQQYKNVAAPKCPSIKAPALRVPLLIGHWHTKLQ